MSSVENSASVRRMKEQSIQSIADQLAGAMSRVSENAAKKAETLEALEKTPAFKKDQEAQQALELAEGEVDALKEVLLERMKKEEQKNVESGDYKIHTAEKVSVVVSDDEKLFTWLKKKKVYDQYVKTDPVIDKKKLNTYVMGLHNDRQLPDEALSGVAVAPNVYIVVKKSNE